MTSTWLGMTALTVAGLTWPPTLSALLSARRGRGAETAGDPA